LESAQAKLAELDPTFADSDVTYGHEPRSVRLEMWVPDREHGRFYHGDPATYLVEIVAESSAEPGAFGAYVGGKGDTQASVQISRWTRERRAEIDVQIAEAEKVKPFHRRMESASARCLRD
jgi:hypothetical protein